MLPSDESWIIEQAKFNYSPLGKSLENQTKTIKDQGEKQNQLKGIENNWLNLIYLLRKWSW